MVTIICRKLSNIYIFFLTLRLSSPHTSLQVDSLKSVVEMRNSELHKLRAQVTSMEQLERDLEAAKDKARSLQAKTEDLNAQMDAKAKAER